MECVVPEMELIRCITFIESDVNNNGRFSRLVALGTAAVCQMARETSATLGKTEVVEEKIYYEPFTF